MSVPVGGADGQRSLCCTQLGAFFCDSDWIPVVQDWAGALAAMGNANAFVLNASWSPAASAARKAALRAALTG